MCRSFFVFISVCLSTFSVFGQITDELPDEILNIKPGKTYTVKDDGFYMLSNVQYTTRGNNATLLDGTLEFDFCGTRAKAPQDGKVVMIDGNIITFGEDGPRASDLVHTSMPLWLSAGSKICVPSGHRTVVAVLLKYDGNTRE